MYPWLTDSFKQLSFRVGSKKLHHAMLIQGPTGIGKAYFTQKLAQLLLCANRQQDKVCGACQPCSLYKSGTHPDLHLVESEKQIGVDQIREAIKKLTGSAQMSGAKVLIIQQADTMTESSANALLKTLEEPTQHTYLLLTTDKPQKILPTIKSRCEKLVLPSPSLDMTINWVTRYYDGYVDRNFAKLYANRPLALLAELEQEPALSFADFSQGLEQLISGQKTVLNLATVWQEHIEKVLKWLQFWVREQFNRVDLNADLLLIINEKAVNVSKVMQNPGVNKLLVLAELLTQVQNVKK
ncbi:DNA polymerase III subunit delta' [Paraglaciecola aquimarina]|uniref:DNA-directed DNA polymerase n=1 Tax=Paraglaciecola algarum TaxID=3050085 RepID=A0ABS9DBP4_9ALTE|nr:DNA polymerase III subunit delta' [Paraglaciecola sp. G1-23]